MELGIITVGNDDASKVYVRKKIQACLAEGIAVRHVQVDGDKQTITEYEDSSVYTEHDTGDIEHAIYESSKKCDGVLLQLPLPDEFKADTQKYIDMIPPEKDVDCLTTVRQGAIMLGDNSFLPCTTQAVFDMITEEAEPTEDVVYVSGRSVLVTKPLIMALINAGYSVRNFCSNHNKEYIDECLFDDLQGRRVFWASGIGQAQYYDEEFLYSIKYTEDLYLYDIGMNRDEDGKLCGDFERDLDVAFQTPVPGGIGPMTVQHVINNLRKLCSK